MAMTAGSSSGKMPRTITPRLAEVKSCPPFSTTKHANYVAAFSPGAQCLPTASSRWAVVVTHDPHMRRHPQHACLHFFENHLATDITSGMSAACPARSRAIEIKAK